MGLSDYDLQLNNALLGQLSNSAKGAYYPYLKGGLGFLSSLDKGVPDRSESYSQRYNQEIRKFETEIRYINNKEFLGDI